MGESETRRALEEAQKLIQQQDAVLSRIMTAAKPLSVVVDVKGERVLAATPRGMLSTSLPEWKVKVGDFVETEPDTGQLVKISEFALNGPIVVASDVGKGFVELSAGGEPRRAFCSIKVEKGERVMLDPSGSVVVANLGKPDSRYSFEAASGIAWEDVGGLESAKRELRAAIELPKQHPELFAKYGKKPTKGILLYGPPGCGKTMLAKAAANALASVSGGKKPGFFYVKGPEMLTKWVGDTEAKIRELFAAARAHKAATGSPALMFIDEADAILGHRGRGSTVSMADTAVPMFLAEMDGFDDAGGVLILATNRQDALDSAVTRDGRVDRKIRISRPGPSDAQKIFEMYLSKKPLACADKDCKKAARLFAASATAALFASEYSYYVVSSERGALPFGLPQLVNGAMIDSIVEQATARAMERDIQNRKVRGVMEADLLAAVVDVRSQNRELNHSAELRDFVEDLGENVKIHKTMEASHAAE